MMNQHLVLLAERICLCSETNGICVFVMDFNKILKEDQICGVNGRNVEQIKARYTEKTDP